MTRRFYVILFLLTALSAAGCKAPDLGELNILPPLAPQAPSFGESLERGYDLLAQYEEFNVGNPAAAARFREKARAGSRALPDNPSESGLSGDEVKELTVAYKMLLQTLEAGTARENEMKMAEAQLNFDCWLERKRSGQKAGSLSTAQWCRERFYVAIEGLARTGPKFFSIYFGTNDAVPDASALAIIRQAVAAYMEHENDEWHIRLTGRSDPKGNREQNMILSMRRALAVRNALAQNGVDPTHISIAAIGGTANKNTENAEQDRRVDIAVIPPSMDRPEKGEPDITKILPQYFGPKGPDL